MLTAQQHMQREWLNARCHILVNSSADWGPSSPFTLFDCIDEFKARGHSEQEALDIFHNNPARFLRQGGKFAIAPVKLAAGS